MHLYDVVPPRLSGRLPLYQQTCQPAQSLHGPDIFGGELLPAHFSGKRARKSLETCTRKVRIQTLSSGLVPGGSHPGRGKRSPSSSIFYLDPETTGICLYSWSRCFPFARPSCNEHTEQKQSGSEDDPNCCFYRCSMAASISRITIRKGSRITYSDWNPDSKDCYKCDSQESERATYDHKESYRPDSANTLNM
jgi:hypothetical protein